jgi:hypothetical protein
VFLENGRWRVTTDDRAREWANFPTRELAIEEARLLADASLPSEVIVHEEDGSISKQYRHRRNPARH